MLSRHASVDHPIPLAYDDTGGTGTPLLLLPGAGDVRAEYRGVVDALRADGRRVISADLPGHGDSPQAESYGVAETAAAITTLIERLDTGPVVIVGTSFAPAAAVTVASERPGLIRGLVAISPHMTAEPSPTATLQTWAIRALLRGPWAAGLWAQLYRSWYVSEAPDDLDDHIRRLREMLSDPRRRRAVRETLTAHRQGMERHLERVAVPSLVMFGSADRHFADPRAEATVLARTMGADVVMVDGAGHYPHAEQPEVASRAIIEFLRSLG